MIKYTDNIEGKSFKYMNIINISLLFLLLLATSGIAAEWLLVSEMDGRKHFVEKESVVEHSGFRWASYKSEYGSTQSGEDFKTKKSYSYITTVSELAINCNKKTLIPIETVYFDKSNNQTHKIYYSSQKQIIGGDRQWELDANPKTFRAAVIKSVCE